jgi:hypothetical protein
MASVGITTRTFLITGASPPPDDLPDFVELIQAEDVLTGRCVSL